MVFSPTNPTVPLYCTLLTTGIHRSSVFWFYRCSPAIGSYCLLQVAYFNFRFYRCLPTIGSLDIYLSPIFSSSFIGAKSPCINSNIFFILLQVLKWCYLNLKNLIFIIQLLLFGNYQSHTSITHLKNSIFIIQLLPYTSFIPVDELKKIFILWFQCYCK